MRVRFLYGESFEVVPSGTLMLTSNHTLEVSGDDDGIWRRLREVPWEVQIPEDERMRLAEDWIRELEPLHQAALKKMNQILSDEQKQKKAEATRSGIESGLSRKELQQSVLEALNLTNQQRDQMTAAKTELQQVLTAMDRQVQGLLTKEQLERLLKKIGRERR